MARAEIESSNLESAALLLFGAFAKYNRDRDALELLSRALSGDASATAAAAAAGCEVAARRRADEASVRPGTVMSPFSDHFSEHADGKRRGPASI